MKSVLRTDAVVTLLALFVMGLMVGCGQAAKAVKSAEPLTGVRPAVDGAKLVPMLSAVEVPSRAEQIHAIYKATPAWTNAYDGAFLLYASELAGSALADVSDTDFVAYCNWVRTDANPKASQDGALLIMTALSDKPENYSVVKLDPALQPTYAIILKAMPDLRALIGDTSAVSGGVDVLARWSDEQLACFMTTKGAQAGMTEEKARHDMWMITSPEGKRLTAAIRDAMAIRLAQQL